MKYVEEKNAEAVLLRIIETVKERFRCVPEFALLCTQCGESQDSQPQALANVMILANVFPFSFQSAARSARAFPYFAQSGFERWPRLFLRRSELQALF